MKFTSAILAATISAASAADFTPIADNGNYATLLGAVVSTGNDQVISDSAPVTIFGPKDSAFAEIEDTVAALSSEELSAVLLNHVIVGAAVSSADVIAAGCIDVMTAGGLRLGIKVDQHSTVTVNGVPVTDFDITGDYGVLHGIESVLLEGVHDFDRCPFPDILSPIEEKGMYGTLLAAVMDTNAIEAITASAPVTIFGPKDSAFAEIAELVATLSPEELSAVLLNHVIVGAVVSAADVIAAGCIEADTAGGLPLAINVDSETGVVTVNGITVSDFDVSGDYGVLHGIDSVLLPETEGDYVPCPVLVNPPAITQVAMTGNYNVLLGLLTDPVVQAQLEGVGSITMFGPDDTAFAASGLDLTDATDPFTLIPVLGKHVVLGLWTADDVKEAGCIMLSTITGGLIRAMYVEGDGGRKLAGHTMTDHIMINEAKVVVNDLSDDSLIFHGIDTLLLSTDVYECPTVVKPDAITQVAMTLKYNVLLGLLTDPVVQGQLEGVGPITMFGPDDAAFAASGLDLTDATDPAALIPVLGKHVVLGLFTADDVKEAGCVMLPTIIGGKIRAMYVEGDGGRKLAGHTMTKDHIMINEAKVVLADIADDSLIFHGIDTLLLSTDVYECPTVVSEAPTAAESSASITGFSVAMAAIVALSAFIF